MNKSDTIGSLAGALAKTQSVIPSIKRTETVDYVMKSGQRKKYSYAPLSGIIDAIRKPLSDNALAVAQFVTCNEGDRVSVETLLMHGSGEWLSDSFAIVGAPQDAQAMGALITYARRYGLSAMLNLAADEDDDAGSATGGDKVEVKVEVEHWCSAHQTEWFKRGKMKTYAHLIKGADPVEWCNEDDGTVGQKLIDKLDNSQPQDAPESMRRASKTQIDSKPPVATESGNNIDLNWLKDSLDALGWVDVGKYLWNTYGVNGQRVSEQVNQLSQKQAEAFVKEVEDRMGKRGIE